MRTEKTRKTGFTLVELIVVIAIIAILAAVSVIGFTRYIENARLSNDNSTASSMTRVVQYYLTDKPEVELDAADVRSLIEENNGGSFDFTPESSGYAFVYIAEDREIALVDVEETIEGGSQLNSESNTKLLSDVANLDQGAVGFGNTPEEVFGENTFLLSKGGSALAEIVYSIRSLALSDDLEGDFQLLTTFASDNAGNQTEQDLFDSFLEEFDPDFNLFVNNNSWSHIPYEANFYSNEFRRIIFQENIRNIPTMTVASIAFIHIDSDVSLPRTVKTIENNALSKVYLKPGTSIITSKLENTIVESSAFSEQQKSNYNISVNEVDSFVELDVDAEWYEPGTETWHQFVSEGPQELTTVTRVRFDITNIPRSQVDDIIIIRVTRASGTFYLVRAYNDETGLLGAKTIPVEYV